MVRLVGRPVTVVAIAVAGIVGASGGVGDADGELSTEIATGVGGDGASAAVVNADGEGGGTICDGEGAAGDVTGRGVAAGVDGEGAVSGRWGCNVSGRSGGGEGAVDDTSGGGADVASGGGAVGVVVVRVA